MRLGVDIDGCLYDWDAAVRQILLSWDLPEELTLQQRQQLENPSYSWNWISAVIEEKNSKWLWQSANETAMFLQGQEIGPSMDALSYLADKHDVYLLTSRPKEAWWQTYRWLGRQADAKGHPAIKGVIHSHNKAAVAAQLDLQVLVDDNVDMLKSYLLKVRGSLRGAYIYGVERPWNRELKSAYYRFKFIDGLQELMPEQERWGNAA